MPKLALQVKFEAENISKISLSDPSSFSWRLKVQCSHCQSISDKHVFICANDQVEQLTGRGTTHLNYKCKNCERKGQVDILIETFHPWTLEEAEKKSSDDGFVTMVQFDCRGVDVESWDPMNHDQTGIVATPVGSEEEMEVDFSEGEWSDYDADNDQAVNIFSLESRTVKVK